jgi:NTE family protein
VFETDLFMEVVMKKISFLPFFVLLAITFLVGCAHYPVNAPLERYDPESGYRKKFLGQPGNSQSLGLYLSFSGGGTRAAALSYGVLEKLRDTELVIDGRRRRLLDEVDGISGVSGGSFTAGYYGLFGDRIFEDFENGFLKKNIQGALTRRIILNPYNWARLLSAKFGRSDLSAEYYDKHVFEGGTFGDIVAREGPVIIINATDMVTGIRVGFIQDTFDAICSDVSAFPVARAAAASSAVPVALTPITLHNYANTCEFTLPEAMQRALKERDVTKRQFHHLVDIQPYLDADKNRYIHLVDGGVADNLGLRAVLDRVIYFGDFWTTLKNVGMEKTHKVVFIVVNAETEVSSSVSLLGEIPGLGAMLKSYSSIAISRYNFETVMLLQESFKRWAEEVRENRCGDGPIDTSPGGCGDIEFYLIEVKFDALKDRAERAYFKGLPTTFELSSEEVDKLHEAAGRLVAESPEFQRLLQDLSR